MPEMRRDPVQMRWVVIATERGNRPSIFIEQKQVLSTEDDPFLEGNESMTPPEVYAVRDEDDNGNDRDKPGWQVRVVPNKYPALKVEGDWNRQGVGLYDRMNGIGAHEVVIETPDPVAQLSDLDPDHAILVVQAWRERLKDLMKDRRLKYVTVFRNQGQVAGASQAHAHSQIVATPMIPQNIAIELKSAQKHYSEKERCIFCDILRQELDTNERIISQNDQFAAFAPYASRFPFEICLMPKYHQHDFRKIETEDLSLFAELLQDVLQRMKIGLNDPPYNLVLHTSPNSETFDYRPDHWVTLPHDWHWHVEIIPRLTEVAGFEWGTGLFINPTSPEQAAEYLRGVMLA